MSRITGRIQALSAICLATLGVLVAASPARADTVAPACPAVELATPFAQWNDFAKYFLVPGGDFESAAAGWRLEGGAALAGENERFHVRSLADKSSLILPPGSTATSPEICVGLEHPTLRFFARAHPPSAARLSVHVLFRTPDNTPRQLRIADLTAGQAWEPTRIIFILANFFALHPNWDGKVAFRFTATSGTVGVDDVFIDPYRR